MAHIVPRSYVTPDEVTWVQDQIAALPANAHVALHLHDGRRLVGVMMDRAQLQDVIDQDGREGINALLRFNVRGADPFEGGTGVTLWLHEVRAVEHLGPVAP